jgi:glucosamine--fructose-6-phosphate aminotransferase (isomerizing)
MCGVFGYIGNRDPVEICLRGLEQLEYRGYDSSGLAGIVGGRIAFHKKAGKLSELKRALPPMQSLSLAIAHTRWATHGKVNDQNAHPHFDEKSSLAVVHNGIIENYDSLREELKIEGVSFISETDTEVIAHLIAREYSGDLTAALQKVVPKLKGIFALLAIHEAHPDEIAAAARDCPLSVAISADKTETIISSDPNTLLGAEYDVVFLRDGEVARVRQGNVEIYDDEGQKIRKKSARIAGALKGPSKEGFQHFMLKEIFEQPATLQKAILGRFENGVAFDELRLPLKVFHQISRVLFIGSGTSSHAGLIGTLLLDDLAKIPAISCIASEARYRQSLMTEDTLVIAISQSGETADTLSALKAVKERGCKTLAICNVMNSTLAREADGTIFLQAGPEVSVCSTKAFTSQIAILFLLTLFMAQTKKTVSKLESSRLYEELKKVSAQVETVLNLSPLIEKMAKKYAHYNNFFFMGRRYMYPTSLEAALKLKEISYVNANGYPAGELKHGPLALLDEHFPVIAFCGNRLTEEKIVSNLMEVKARGAPVLAIAPEKLKALERIADDLIWVPDTIDELAAFPSTVAGQLFAYYFAKERGCDIDQPRNLAKSVTVE